MKNSSYYSAGAGSGLNREINYEFLIVNSAGHQLMTNIAPIHRANGSLDFCMLFIDSGKLELHVRDDIKIISCGELIFLPPRTEYGYCQHSAGETSFFWIHFTGYGVASLFKECLLSYNDIISTGQRDLITDNIKAICGELMRRGPCFDVMNKSIFLYMLSVLGRENGASSDKKYRPESIAASLEFIHNNFCGDISADELAQMEHLSVSRYRSVFRHTTGVPLKSYIINLRMNKAHELLEQTDLSVADVAEMVGYHDQLYFSRLFKKYASSSPNQYRKRLADEYPPPAWEDENSGQNR